jgi:sulfoxide reductase catalytic subunit YedY
MEERIYRHRCVEAWAMTVPWTGFPLSALLNLVEPLSAATHVAFITADRPDQMLGMSSRAPYPWPYFEGLRLDEAMNELTLVATGLYGEPLPRQTGAPIRIVTPWKYGYKSIKSVVRIELTHSQPATFWNTLNPREYSFLSNVDPAVPHPRWSQARELLILDASEVDTMLYNGYGEYVAHLYS